MALRLPSPEGNPVWRSGLLLEPDGERWIIAVEALAGTAGHLDVGGIAICLVVGSPSQLRNPAQCPTVTGSLPGYREMFRAYMAFGEAERDLEYLTPDELDAAPPAAAAAASSSAAPTSQAIAAAAAALGWRPPEGSRATPSRPALMFGDGRAGDDEAEDPMAAAQGPAQASFAQWIQSVQGVWQAAAGAAAASPALSPQPERGRGSLLTGPPAPSLAEQRRMAEPPVWGAPAYVTPSPVAVPQYGAPWPPPAPPSAAAPPRGVQHGPPAAPWAQQAWTPPWPAAAPCGTLPGAWGAAPSAACPSAAAGFGGPGDFQTLLQMELLRALAARGTDQEADWPSVTEGGARGVERSLRTLHNLKKEVASRPGRVIDEFSQTVKEQLGVQPGQAFNFQDFNRRIPWGHQKTLQRAHYMLGEIYLLLDSGRALEAQATVAQCMKATHQAALDSGDWRLAWHLTTLRDPFQRQQFGGSARELEAIAAYSRALEDLESRMKKEKDRGRSHEEHDKTDEPGEGAGGRKAKGKGK